MPFGRVGCKWEVGGAFGFVAAIYKQGDGWLHLVPRQKMENFAGVMNFVIFPMFFASTALYPLWRIEEVSPWLATMAWLNPFSHAVELIRFSLYGKCAPLPFVVCLAGTLIFFAIAMAGYDPGRGFWRGKTAATE